MRAEMLSVEPEPGTRLSSAAAAIERQWPVDESPLRSLVDDLKRNDERTRFALGVARTGVWEAELFTGQVEWSETMHLAMGRPSSSFDGTVEGMASLIHPDDRDKFAGIIHGNFDRPRDFNIDVRVVWPDGCTHWVQLRGQVSADAGGMSVRLLSVAQDITPQKELELKLRQAQKMEAMGRLAGGVAHDFNNILTAILGYAVLIETEPAEVAELRNHAVQIRRAAERATALTRQLLAFSRRQVIERRSLHLADVINDLLPMLSKILGEHIQIVREFTDHGYPVFADPGQLQQVLLNLAINARDAMAGGGNLTFATSNVTLPERDRMQRFKAPKGDYLRLAVTDTGSGMAASTCERIFDPFFTTKNEGEGTGLGLSTVFEIVKSMGGAIRVASEPGHGTTFYIYLPRTDRTPNCEPILTAAEAIGGAETIMVVEDEEGVRTLVTSMLQRAGYHVVTAADADQARKIASERPAPVDLVLADVMMPDGTGPELVHSLGTTEYSPRALYMSGYAGAVLARQGRMANDSEFLQKPFTGVQLLAKIRQLLDAPAA